jgi:hypothetical protein
MKNQIIFLLCLSMLLPCFAQGLEQPTELPLESTVKSTMTGDVDNDGKISIADVVAIVDYILSGSSDIPAAADVDFDGVVSVAGGVSLIDAILSGQQEIHAISSAYYYIGTSNNWTPYDATYKLDNGGGNVYANPVFTVEIPATSGYNWFKIYPQETMDVAEADFWTADFIGYSQDGANGMSGTFVEGPNDQVAFSFKIPPSTTAVSYRLSFDMKNRTFEFEPILASDTAQANQLFKKCYDYVNGGVHINGMDDGYTDYVRQLWTANELTTDEAICCWGDTGVPEFNFNHYDASHPMLAGSYFSLYACIGVCNEYLDQFSDLDAVKTAEVRFLRALHYFYLLDFWGNVPLVTTTCVDNIPQSSRVELFQWLEQELLNLRDGLCEPVIRHEGEADYGRVDRDAANLLLARLYLNAQVYTGVARWADAARYAKMVIDGPHKLHTQSFAGNGIDGVYREYTPYQMLFMGDNGNTAAAAEAVFPLPRDGAQIFMDNSIYGWGGTTFLIASTFDWNMHENPYNDSEVNGLGTNGQWAGNRARPQLVRQFFPNDDAPNGQPGYMVAKLGGDDRALFNTGSGRTLENTNPSDFFNGYAVAKFNNFKTNGSVASHPTFSDADFFLMRSAEAYLTYAEALTCQAGGVAPAQAVDALNAIRARAHAEQRMSYTLNQIMDEWSREFYFEGRRRMDLIRFNCFGGTTDYLWSWKGGILGGRNFPAFRNVFAIPAAAMVANPNLVQNPGYEEEAAQTITFDLSTPVHTLVDIDDFMYIPFEWTEPDYYLPSSLYYRLEVSPTNEWNVSIDEAAADKTGQLQADYAVLTPTHILSLSSEMTVVELNWALAQICHWSEDNLPDRQTVYVRCVASDQYYSNVVSLEIKPYYVGTAGQPVNLWYLVGNCIGSQPWSNNGVYDIGYGLIPMYPAYDTDGAFMGSLMYVGYFPAGGQFKFVHEPGRWDEQLDFTNVKNPGSFLSDEDGDNHIIGINEAGYYTIRIDANDDITIEKYENSVTYYDLISIPSDYQGWDPLYSAMNAVSTMGNLINHDWVTEVTVDEGSEVRFVANGDWDINWGNATHFPYGQGSQNAGNIKVPAGWYLVLFNDIMGTYIFVDLDADPEPYVPYIPYVPSISSAYYYIGSSNDWTPNDATYKLNNGGGDVYDHPVFTVTVPATGGDNWFKIYPQETMNADGDDFWNSDFIGYYSEGSNGMSGTFVKGRNDQTAFSFVIPASIPADSYELTFDMKNRSFMFKAIEAPVEPPEPVLPDLWYLMGSGFGDGSWSNTSTDDVGVSLVPMYGMPGSANILKWVGYLAARRTFKIIHTPGESEQLSMVDGVIALNNGEGGNIRVNDAGYYEIMVNTSTYEVNIEKLDISPSAYSTMGMPGGYQYWNPGANLMTAVNTRAENHDWIVKDFVVTEATELKFAADGNWYANWGGSEFPFGLAGENGPNIPVALGTYTVMFNDILGYYYFMAQ